VLLVLVGILVEAGAYLVQLASSRVLDEPIRRRSTILREQTDRIAPLLDATSARREVLDSLLGWRYRPGYSSATDHLNTQGLRARREYDSAPAAGTVRVAAFGDSFVYGMEVRDDDAWCALLEAGPGHLEVLNYGVGGYGLDQAFLRFQREGMAFHPEVVLIGFAPDDLRRIVNVYRRFLSSHEWPLAKPRFVLRADGTLALVPNPLARRADYIRLMEHPRAVRELGTLDWWYSATVYEHPLYDLVATLRVGHAVWQRLQHRVLDPGRLLRGGVFNERSAAFALQAAVLRAFADAVRDNGAVPAVVMMPDRSSVESLRRGGAAVYAPLRGALRERGITVWDASEAFRTSGVPVSDLFAAGGHYSPAGNRVLADWLAPRVAALRRTPDSRARAAPRR
jgi:hypothetical protein